MKYAIGQTRCRCVPPTSTSCAVITLFGLIISERKHIRTQEKRVNDTVLTGLLTLMAERAFSNYFIVTRCHLPCYLVVRSNNGANVFLHSRIGS